MNVGSLTSANSHPYPSVEGLLERLRLADLRRRSLFSLLSLAPLAPAVIGLLIVLIVTNTDGKWLLNRIAAITESGPFDLPGVFPGPLPCSGISAVQPAIFSCKLRPALCLRFCGFHQVAPPLPNLDKASGLSVVAYLRSTGPPTPAFCRRGPCALSPLARDSPPPLTI